MRRLISLLVVVGLLIPAGVSAQDSTYPVDERTVDWSDEPIEFLVPAGSQEVVGLHDEDFCAWVAYAMGIDVSADDLERCASGVAAPETAVVPESMLPAIVAELTVEPADPPSAEPQATAKPAKKKAKPKPRKANHKRLSKRAWQRMVKAPDRYLGKEYILWACITQFDAATGEDTFRADASYKNWRGDFWYQGVNSFFTGTKKKLRRYVEDDLVWMKVSSWGSFSYDTQSGGNTTVPMFSVDQIKRVGSC